MLKTHTDKILTIIPATAPQSVVCVHEQIKAAQSPSGRHFLFSLCANELKAHLRSQLQNAPPPPPTPHPFILQFPDSQCSTAFCCRAGSVRRSDTANSWPHVKMRPMRRNAAILGWAKSAAAPWIMFVPPCFLTNLTIDVRQKENRCCCVCNRKYEMFFFKCRHGKTI